MSPTSIPAVSTEVLPQETLERPIPAIGLEDCVTIRQSTVGSEVIVGAEASEAFEDPDFPPCPPPLLESDEPPLESSLHLQQLILLLQCLEWLWKDRDDYFAAGNLTVYYSRRQKKSEFFRGPDFFVVRGTEKRPRASWTVWEEGGIYPHVIIELLSDSTEKNDRSEKKEIYQNIFRTHEYFWFHPTTLEFRGFQLMNSTYIELEPNEQGHLWSQQLELFLGVLDQKLRFFLPDGTLAPTPQESAIASEAKVKSLAAKLRELGIEPD